MRYHCALRTPSRGAFRPRERCRLQTYFIGPRHRSYAIPGHRLGGLVASPTFLSQISKLLDCMQICPARPAQRAVEWAIKGLAEWRRETREELQDRQRVFRELLLEKEVEGWEVATGGAYFAYVGFSLIPISCRCRVLAKLTPP